MEPKQKHDVVVIHRNMLRTQDFSEVTRWSLKDGFLVLETWNGNVTYFIPSHDIDRIDVRWTPDSDRKGE